MEKTMLALAVLIAFSCGPVALETKTQQPPTHSARDVAEIQEVTFRHLLKTWNIGKRMNLQVRTMNGSTLVSIDPIPEVLLTKLAAQFPKVETGTHTTYRGGQVVDAKTGERMYVLTIGSIHWRNCQAEIDAEGSEGMLGGGGSTLVFEKKNGKWTIISEHGGWVS